MIGKVTVAEVRIDDEQDEELIMRKLALITANSKNKLTAEQVFNMLRLRFEFLWDPKDVLEMYDTKEYRILLVEGAKDARRESVRNIFFAYMRSRDRA